jgi:hypothetical protein
MDLEIACNERFGSLLGIKEPSKWI